MSIMSKKLSGYTEWQNSLGSEITRLLSRKEEGSARVGESTSLFAAQPR